MKIGKMINFKQLLKGILIFILFYYSSLVQLVPIYLFNLNIESQKIQVILSTFSNLVLLIILILIYKKELKKEWFKFKDKFITNIDIGIKYWLIGLFLMMISNIILNFLVKAGGAANEKSVQEMIKCLPWLMLISAGIIAPINEEIVFRKAFKNTFLKKWLFVLMSGLVFGALHVITSYKTPIELLYIIPYSSLGISFALMYSKTDTIYTSISMHMLHNLILTTLSIIAL